MERSPNTLKWLTFRSVRPGPSGTKRFPSQRYVKVPTLTNPLTRCPFAQSLHRLPALTSSDPHLADKAQQLILFSLDEEKGRAVVMAALDLVTEPNIARGSNMKLLTFKAAQLLLADGESLLSPSWNFHHPDRHHSFPSGDIPLRNVRSEKVLINPGSEHIRGGEESSTRSETDMNMSEEIDESGDKDSAQRS